MNLSSFIWAVADLLRGKYKPHEYGQVILPFTVLRRMDCVLEPTKKVVLKEAAKREFSAVSVNPFLTRASGATFVVGSRLEAVRWQLAMQKYIQSRGYRLSALVAFSGEVNDKESGEDPFTEMSKALNPNLRGRDIREAFKTDEYQILRRSS
jgi:type I restriction-modification system DNA methylase subunit